MPDDDELDAEIDEHRRRSRAGRRPSSASELDRGRTRSRRYAPTSASARRSSGSSNTSRSSTKMATRSTGPTARGPERAPRPKTHDDEDSPTTDSRDRRGQSEQQLTDISPATTWSPPSSSRPTAASGRYDLYSGCSRRTSSSSARRSTTRSPTWSAPSCCTSSRRTPTRTSTSTSTRPGGDINALFAIYDTMQYIKPDITTICFGQAASAAAVLLAAGTPGQAPRPAPRPGPDPPALRRGPGSGLRHRARIAKEILRHARPRSRRSWPTTPARPSRRSQPTPIAIS